MSDEVIETYLDALVNGDWDTFAGCLADDGFTRVGPFGDVKPTKAEYVAFLSDLMPTLPGYSMDVTRVIGRKMRRRPGTSITRPSTRGASRPMRSVTTTSRTRPTWSPIGSKTAVSARRAMKTLVCAPLTMPQASGVDAPDGRS